MLALLVTPNYFGHPSLCSNYVVLCVINVGHCVKRGCLSLSLIGSILPTLFTLVDTRRTRARKSRFSFLARSSGSPSSVLYSAGKLVLLACHWSPDQGLCFSQPNTLLSFNDSFRLVRIYPVGTCFVPFLNLTPVIKKLTYLRTFLSSHDKAIGLTLGMRRGCVL